MKTTVLCVFNCWQFVKKCQKLIFKVNFRCQESSESFFWKKIFFENSQNTMVSFEHIDFWPKLLHFMTQSLVPDSFLDEKWIFVVCYIFCVRNGKFLMIQWAKKGPKQDFGSEKDSQLKMSQFLTACCFCCGFIEFENKSLLHLLYSSTSTMQRLEISRFSILEISRRCIVEVDE